MTDIGRQFAELEGRVAALSGLVGVLIWVLRKQGVTDEALTRLVFTSTSDAVGALPADLGPSADRLITALKAATA